MDTFQIDGPLELDLRLAAGDVEVAEAADGTATVQLTATSPGGQELIDEARVATEATADGTRLVVHVPERPERPRWRGLRRDAVSIRVTVPRGSAIDVAVAAADVTVTTQLRAAHVVTASGDVALRDVTGPVQVRSASGDVRVGDVEGDVEVNTASGDVRIGSVSGTARLRTVSGDVVTGRLADEVTVRSVSGDVRVAEVAGRRADTNSTSGDLDLALAPGRRVHLDVASVSGRLTSELDDDAGGEEVAVDLQLRARTVSGDVTLRRGPAPRPRSAGVAIL